MKKLAGITLALLMSLSSFNLCFAENINLLTENPPIISEIEPYDAHKPGTNASVHNLSISNYEYKVEEIGYKVYTNKWLTGSSTMDIFVKNIRIINTGTGAAMGLKISIYDENDKRVAIKSVDTSLGRGNVSFSGLSSNKKYYVCFETSMTGLKWAFDGFISE